MIKGYDDDRARVRIVHMPLSALLNERAGGRILNAERKDLMWGRFRTGYACLNWPQSRVTGSGYNPFTGRQARRTRS